MSAAGSSSPLLNLCVFLWRWVKGKETQAQTGWQRCALPAGFSFSLSFFLCRSCEALSQNSSKTTNYIPSGAISGQMQPWRLWSSFPNVALVVVALFVCADTAVVTVAKPPELLGVFLCGSVHLLTTLRRLYKRCVHYTSVLVFSFKKMIFDSEVKQNMTPVKTIEWIAWRYASVSLHLQELTSQSSQALKKKL